MVNNISGIKNIMLVSTILEIRHDFFLKITFLIFQYIPVHHQDFPVQIFSSTQKGSFPVHFPVHFSFQYIPVHLRNSSTQWPPWLIKVNTNINAIILNIYLPLRLCIPWNSYKTYRSIPWNKQDDKLDLEKQQQR